MAMRQAPCLHQYRPDLLIINRRPKRDILQRGRGFPRQDLRDSVPVEMNKGANPLRATAHSAAFVALILLLLSFEPTFCRDCRECG